MIKRVWRGWTTPDNADRYQSVLLNKVIPMIEAKEMPEYRGIEVLREDLADEVEFSTTMIFDTLEGVKAFQGTDYARCHVPGVAKAVLSRWDEFARHYHVVAEIDAPSRTNRD